MSRAQCCKCEVTPGFNEFHHDTSRVTLVHHIRLTYLLGGLCMKENFAGTQCLHSRLEEKDAVLGERPLEARQVDKVWLVWLLVRDVGA